MLPALGLLYLPILLLGWIGISQTRSVEDELTTFRGIAEPILQGAAKEFGLKLEGLVGRILAPLSDKRSLEELIESLRTLNEFNLREGSSEFQVAFLLPKSVGQQRNRPLRPTYPRLPRLEPRRYLGQLRATISSANLLGENVSPKAAVDYLENIPVTSPNQRALLAFEKASWMTKAGMSTEAAELCLGTRQRLEAVPARSSQTNRNLILLDLMHCELLALAKQETEALAQRRKNLGLQILTDIAGGKFDADTDDNLETLCNETAEALVDLSAKDADLELRIRTLLGDNQDRSEIRREVRALYNDGTFFRLGEEDLQSVDFVTRSQWGRSGTSILALMEFRVPSEGDSNTRSYLAGIKIDLASLFSQNLIELETRLLATGNSYQVELLDLVAMRAFPHPNDRLDPKERELAKPIKSVLRLRQHLSDFSLEATPTQPQSIINEKRNRVWLRALSLALLLATALGAGFLFLRTVRNTAEFARLKAGFVARVSHELRTPLSLIRMYGETIALGRVKDAQKTRDFAGIIAKESDRLSRMIDNVLDFSLIEAGTKSYDPRPTRLDTHLEEILESYEPHLAENGFELVWRDLSPITANVDPEGLTQAIVNLVGNARKYTALDGEKQILVGLEQRGDRALIEVLDRGIGVPASEKQLIFETFYRASTAEEGKGVGLGLALVRHFAEAHGGRVLCEDRPGGGSCFRLELPISVATDQHSS